MAAVDPLTKKIPVVEIFGPTVQGEGAVLGQQTYFIRYGLCDYACTMCDSMHAVDPISVKANAEWLTQVEIFNKFRFLHKPNSTTWITFSGGNPCIHNLTELCRSFQQAGFQINVETQGTMWQDFLNHVDWVTISPKGPGMGEKLELDKLDKFIDNLIGRPTKHRSTITLKVVVFDQRDLEVAKAVFTRYSQVIHPSQWYLSLGNPMPPGYQEQEIPHDEMMKVLIVKYLLLLEDIQQDPILNKARFTPQWHTFLWGNAKGR